MSKTPKIGDKIIIRGTVLHHYDGPYPSSRIELEQGRVVDISDYLFTEVIPAPIEPDVGQIWTSKSTLYKLERKLLHVENGIVFFYHRAANVSDWTLSPESCSVNYLKRDFILDTETPS